MTLWKTDAMWLSQHSILLAQPKHTFTSQHEGIVLEVYMNYSTPDKEMLKRRQEDFNYEIQTGRWKGY